MEATYIELATRISDEMYRKQPDVLLVGIAGPPGSGKSTLTARVAELLNASLGRQNNHSAVMVSLDGFHLTRRQLLELPDAEQAILRRGAPWTFDVSAVVAFVQALRRNASLPAARRIDIMAPSFDHAVKDPVMNDTIVPREASVVILEHNYLLLDEPGWRDAAALLDLKISLEVDPEVARLRVARRHVETGIEASLEQALRRFDQNDGLNGMLIRSRALKCDLRIQSEDSVNQG